MTFKNWLSGLLIVVAIALPLSAQADEIVVNHDERSRTNFGYSTGAGFNDQGVFVTNVVRSFMGGAAGTVHD